jgi:hypothetical protein
LKSQRDFRNYLAGAALAFGVVLLVNQVLQLMYGGLALADRESVYALIMEFNIASHIIGGGLGGYLVARVRRTNYILTGTLTAVIAIIFEFSYNELIYQQPIGIYEILCLLIGGIIGAMFMRARLGSNRITSGIR